MHNKKHKFACCLLLILGAIIHPYLMLTHPSIFFAHLALASTFIIFSAYIFVYIIGVKPIDLGEPKTEPKLILADLVITVLIILTAAVRILEIQIRHGKKILEGFSAGDVRMDYILFFLFLLLLLKSVWHLYLTHMRRHSPTSTWILPVTVLKVIAMYFLVGFFVSNRYIVEDITWGTSHYGGWRIGLFFANQFMIMFVFITSVRSSFLRWKKKRLAQTAPQSEPTSS